MQSSSKFLIFFSSFTLLAAISFFVGINIGSKNTKLVYITTPGKTTFFSPLQITGSFISSTGGKVQNITPNTLTIENNNNQATFNLNKDTSVFTRDIKPSSASGTMKISSLSPETKVPITNIKIGETVALELKLSQQEITIKSISLQILDFEIFYFFRLTS